MTSEDAISAEGSLPALGTKETKATQINQRNQTS
jgi:hypothetical protein